MSDRRKGRPSCLAPLTEAQRALCAEPRHVRLATAIAAAQGRRFPPLADEFESAAYVGLVEAAAAFDPTRGVRFATFAAVRIRGAIEDARRAAAPAGYRRRGGAPAIDSLDVPLDGPGRATLGGTIDDGCDPPESGLEYQDELEGLARRLPRVVARLFRLLYGRADCLTMAAAGRALGLSESRISQVHGLAMDLLNERFGSSGDLTMSGASRLEMSDRPPATNGAPAPAAGNPCPDCGHERGKRDRCLRCHPRRPPSPRATAPAIGAVAPVPAPAPPLADTLAGEFDLMRRLAALDAPAARRVLAWATAYLAGEAQS